MACSLLPCRPGLRLLIFRIGTRAGLPDAGVHRFRHTFAISFLRNGGNLLALQDLLGHERMDTVRIYAKQAEVDLERQEKGRVASGSVEVVGGPHSQCGRSSVV